MLRLLTVLILCSSLLPAAPEPDWIPWRPNGRLSWNDFRGSPPPLASNAALTSSGVSLNYSSGSSFSYRIGCHFDQKKSWGRVRNRAILAHEQGHFDLSEVYARQLNKALRQYRYNPSTAGKDVNIIYQEVMRDLQDKQNEYDQQTDHSRNDRSQEKWLVAIGQQLKSLEKYKDYE